MTKKKRERAGEKSACERLLMEAKEKAGG